MASITPTLQNLTPGAKISLYRIDTRKVGGGEYFFCQASQSDQAVKFGGVVYSPVDIEVEGFEVTAGGSLPTPTLRIANSDLTVQALVNTFGDLLGCEVQRVRTFHHHLDGQMAADPTAYLGPDTFEIERKTDENYAYIEWELSAAIDQDDALLPKRTVIRDTCLFRYRNFNPNTGRFDYSKCLCPYAGGAMFDRNDNPTSDPTKDECSRRVGGCKLRFGANNPLPFGGFTGASRVR
ncbi:phage minor tail protein L [Aureimonas sp. AU40]|uniref:phage minor tail protein L n=1 Tax=Aureimonas sp. AU40 TaxID=1637747 RepID=UPI000784BD0A|nr:phage minor tail protein L [Aureimonas sp. AU40]